MDLEGFWYCVLLIYGLLISSYCQSICMLCPSSCNNSHNITWWWWYWDLHDSHGNITLLLFKIFFYNSLLLPIVIKVLHCALLWLSLTVSVWTCSLLCYCACPVEPLALSLLSSIFYWQVIMESSFYFSSSRPSDWFRHRLTRLWF